ncbi:hypothetical protein ZYGR_0H05370 [Zygosaccharomyces rouxii]|uniref:PIN domain-containing protein n=1 Tax=Zygosaccharomyces rouxii TaxID=4956 RepID=A0A1Q2ZW57_ZYGRO|nr:hypothetical protein ZYGR_0H05370 [Zygosaccharomyces rouxii]
MIETFNHAKRRQTDKNTNDSSMIGMTPSFTNEINNSTGGVGDASAAAQSVFGTITGDLTREDSDNNNSNNNGEMNNSNNMSSSINPNVNPSINASNINPRLKRSSSNTYNYVSANFVKRRLPNQEEIFPQQSQFLDTSLTGAINQSISVPNTPSKAPTSRRPSLPKKAIDTSSASNYGGAGGGGTYALGSPYCSLPNVSTFVSNVDLASKAAIENSVQKLPCLERNSSNYLQTTPSRLDTPYLSQDQNSNKYYHHGISAYPPVNSGDNSNHHNNMNTNSNTTNNDNDNNNNNTNYYNNHNNRRQNETSKIADIQNSVSVANTNNNNNFDIKENRGNGDCNQDGNNNNGNTNENNFNMNNNGNNNNSINNRSGNNDGRDSNNNSNSNSNNNNNDNNNNNGNRAVPSVVVPSKRSSQALVQKLQDIYKVIVKQEIELQERCSQLTTSQTTELKNLWTIYKINSDLINNYVTFLTTALLPSQTEQDILIGEEIVEIYRIERRLWVYGTITFLDIFKNFSNFMDPEVCCQFITHVFISISNMLGDIPPKYGIPWLQRLGDLSRMAIALYPSGFIDWKLSAEHWYMEAMKFTYSHGKLYYHMSTVQQNTLEAFVNLGKSVFCQDTFIPSQQYMQLVIDNIYQRAFVERNNGNHRNTQLIEYLKHSEVMLLPSFLESADLQQVVLIYFKAKFGCDSNNVNIFDTRKMFCQNPDYLRYFFRHAPAFAESHILQLVGFGDPKNPFALLFELPRFLKDRKDKKEKRRTKSTTVTETSSTMAIDDLEDEQSDRMSTPEGFFGNIETLRFPYSVPSNLEIWNESLNYINMTSLKCSMVVLQKFLKGPLVVALPHFMPWTYFIISLAYKIKDLNHQSSRKFWVEFVDRIFPWNTIVSFLNVLIAYMLDNSWKSSLVDSLCGQYSSMGLEDLLDYFNNNEVLPEVWKCWGTLWFDTICNKEQSHVEDLESVGIKNHMFLDAPIDGIAFDANDESGENFWKRACRIIFLFKGLAENFPIGITLSPVAPVYCRRNDVSPYHILKSFSFKLRRGSDSELVPMNPPQPSTTAIDLDHLKNTLEIFEEASWENIHMDTIPMLSVIEGESIFDYAGYRRLHPDYFSYDKNGEFLSASLYTSWYANNNTNNTGVIPAHGSDVDSQRDAVQSVQEMHIFNQIMEPGYCGGFADDLFLRDALYQTAHSSTTYFVLDTTTWLRHFGHIYKLASSGVLKFAICLTTFHELRFLRKPKDENVVEAATRAIITVRQLYSEGKLLPLRFTGNVATHIEEHLEFEEKITWRSHVDEFVIEAVYKAQSKFQEMNQLQLEQEEQQHQLRAHDDRSGLKFVVLVTDDSNMRKKAQDQDVRTFSTKFVFSLCNSIGLRSKICTN